MKKRKFGLPVNGNTFRPRVKFRNPGEENEWGIESQAKASAADAVGREPTANSEAIKKTTRKFLFCARSKSL